MKRVQSRGMGYVFSSSDFLDLGNRGAVDVALFRLLGAGKIRRVARGLYDYPRVGKLLGGPLAPDVEQVAQADARKSGTRIHRSGAQAANMLGLSQQVPAKVIYMTDGPSKTLRVGSQTITFKHVHPKHFGDDEQITMAVQAIRHLGKHAIGEHELRRLREVIPQKCRNRFLAQARQSAAWVGVIAKKVMEGMGNG